jgi:hypothetical protein
MRIAQHSADTISEISASKQGSSGYPTTMNLIIISESCGFQAQFQSQRVQQQRLDSHQQVVIMNGQRAGAIRSQSAWEMADPCIAFCVLQCEAVARCVRRKWQRRQENKIVYSAINNPTSAPIEAHYQVARCRILNFEYTFACSTNFS